MRVQARASVALMGVLVLAGCDKMPWSNSSDDDLEVRPLSAADVRQPIVPHEELLATANGAPITKLDLEVRLEELKALAASAGQPLERLPAEAGPEALSLSFLLDELVNQELLSQQALARGLDRKTDTQRRWNYLRRQFYSQEWVQWHQEREDVTSDEVTRYYEQFKAGFRAPERIRARQLTVSSEAEAKAALVQLHGGADFETLARGRSTGPQKAQGGLIAEWILRGNDKAIYAPQDPSVISLDSSLESAVFAIDEPNRISNYVKGPDGQYHIFQLVEREGGQVQLLADVWDDVKLFLMMEKLSLKVEALRAEADVETFPERLEDVEQ